MLGAPKSVISLEIRLSQFALSLPLPPPTGPARNENISISSYGRREQRWPVQGKSWSNRADNRKPVAMSDFGDSRHYKGERLSCADSLELLAWTFSGAENRSLYMKSFSLCILLSCGAFSAALVARAQTYTWTTIAGSPGASGSADGTNNDARFNYPNGIALDLNGNLYVSDSGNSTIRKLTLSDTNWVSTTLAGTASVRGSADGTNGTARFSFQDGITADISGNLYVADYVNSTIRKLTPVGTNWVVSTLAGLPGTTGRLDGTNGTARFNGPIGVAVDVQGNVAVAEFYNMDVRRLVQQGTNWVVSTVAGRFPGSGDGTNLAAQFLSPYDIAADQSGSFFVADADNYTIRKVSPAGTNWVVSTIAGLARTRGSVDGSNSAARFGRPTSLAVGPDSDVFVTDGGSNTVRRLTRSGSNWIVSTIGGMPGVSGTADGEGANARFMNLQAIAVDPAGNLYVADADANTIRLGRPTPRLQAKVSAHSLILNWTALDPEYVLETTSSFSSGTEWTTVTNGLRTNANMVSFTNTLDGICGFYRLRRQ